MSRHRVRVAPIPDWVDASRLLGPGDWVLEPVEGGRAATAELDRDAAADVQARLRGVGLGGHAVRVEVAPPLKRRHVRDARTRDARARRDTTPGFTRPGTRLDEEGRISLTPEALALEIGQRVAGRRVLDAGCGAGGNTIGFARAGCRVVAVEQDADRLGMARHNARIYGFASGIAFVRGDAVAEARALAADVLFVDPPWGADWDRARTVLADLPLLGAILEVFGEGNYGRLLAKVPPSFDPATVPGARAEALFGEAPGDRRRVKLVLLHLGETP